MAKGSKKMVITIDVETGKVEKITDEKGERAKTAKKGALKLGDRTITSVPDHTLILTHSSPGCAWYFIGGKWYYI
jgi:hypothetical protein